MQLKHILKESTVHAPRPVIIGLQC